MASAIVLLKQDHRDVERLFAQFKQSRDKSIAAQICEALEVHTALEEEVLYPVLRSDVTGGADMAGEAEHEHAEAKQLIGRIKRTSSAEHLAEVMAELEAAIEHHVEEEEDEVFPKVERELGSDRIAQLGDDLLQRKEQIKAA